MFLFLQTHAPEAIFAIDAVIQILRIGAIDAVIAITQVVAPFRIDAAQYQFSVPKPGGIPRGFLADTANDIRTILRRFKEERVDKIFAFGQIVAGAIGGFNVGIGLMNGFIAD
jgi:hypothetical protein